MQDSGTTIALSLCKLNNNFSCSLFCSDPNTRSAHFRPPTSSSSSRYQSSSSYKLPSTSSSSFISPPFWPVYSTSSTAYLSFSRGSTDSALLPPSTAFFSSQHRLGLWLALIPRLLLFGDDADEASSSEENLSLINTRRNSNKTSSSSYHTLSSVPYQSYEGIVRSAQMIAAGQNRSRLWPSFTPGKSSEITSSSSKKVNGLRKYFQFNSCPSQ